MAGRSEVSEVKKKEVMLVKDLISKYRTIGILDLTNLPSPQLQDARKKIDVNIRVTKKRLLKIALNDVDKGVEKLEDSLEKIIPALILTNNSSFKLLKRFLIFCIICLTPSITIAALKPNKIGKRIEFEFSVGHIFFASKASIPKTNTMNPNAYPKS